MQRIILLVSMLCCLSINIQAKSDKRAKKILDQTAAAIKKAGDIEASFKATTFKGTEEQANVEGVIYLHDRAFHIITDKIIYWYDGETMWNYVKDNNEVNISTPPFYDQQAMNPYTFISLYRKGFEYDYDEGTLRGKDCYSIHLRCIEKTQKIKEMYLDIDKSTFHPLCIRLRKGTEAWTRIVIQKYKINQKYDENKFQFKKSEYPNAEIIDLRK